MQLTIDGESFRVEVEGADDRPAVLLSPSLGTDLSLFVAQMPVLLEHFRVVRYDPRGHGASTTAGAPYSLSRLGRDALAILDALGIETAHFIGISMGGAVGQWLLVNAPQRIGRAVLANTSARLGTPDLWNARITGVLAQGTQALAQATMERWFSPAFRERAPERVAAIEAVFSGTAAEGYAGACAALRDMDLRESIFSIDRPVLIVTGREDAVTSEADIAAMTGAIRGARHVALDCRHISNIEQEAAFNAAVVAFLTAPTPAKAPRPRKPPMRRRATGARATAARSPLKPAASGTKKTAGARATPAKAARGTARAGVAKASATKKAGTKRAAAKKTGRRLPTARRPAAGARKLAATRVGPKKAAPTKKTAAKKTTAKKTVAKKPGARRPAARRPSPKRPGRPGRRPKR